MIDRNLDALPSGHELDGYRIGRELGSGGFGITYLAIEIESGRRVAIKEFMPKAFARRGESDLTVRPVTTDARSHFDWGLDRFREEARALIRLNHPNIVQTLRLFSAHGTAYIVMNYVEGESLAQRLRPAATLPQPQLDTILPPLLDGLEAVHRAGYLHRDLKPANIFIRSSDGQPVLLDFGAAREALGRETRTLSAIVTPGFSPPEQYGRGERQREVTDIYALGATLYRCVAGQTPPEAPDRVTAMVANEPDPLVPASRAKRDAYAPSLLAAIDAALSIRESERPQSVAHFRAMLGGAAPAPVPTPASAPVSAGTRPAPERGETLIAGGPPASRRLRPDARTPATRRLVLPLLAAILLLAIGGGVYGFTEWRAAAQHRAAAHQIELARAAMAGGAFAEAEKHLDEAARLQPRSPELGRLRAALADAKRKAADDARRKAAARTRIAAGAQFSDCAGCPAMVVVPAGSFTMGSPASEAGRYDYEGPQHTVTIAKPFAIGKTEITRGEWDRFVRDSGHRSVDSCVHFTGKKWLRDEALSWRAPGFDQADNHPVVCIDWRDASAYVAWLSAKSGKRYRLPSEAEWEYAARAGTTGARPWEPGSGAAPEICTMANGADLATRQAGLDFPKIADCDDGYAFTAPVGRFPASRFGLYGMIGNVWEWTEDCWTENYEKAATGATPVTDGGKCGLRSVRGGGWINGPADLRAAVRVFGNVRFGYNYVGFRVARDVE